MITQGRTVGIRELKTRLETYLRQVREGATLVVTDRGRPIAELRPLAMAADGLHYAHTDLAARSVLGGTLGERKPLDAFEAIEAESSLSEATIADREDRF
jgi:prevent-host-death family protein